MEFVINDRVSFTIDKILFFGEVVDKNEPHYKIHISVEEAKKLPEIYAIAWKDGEGNLWFNGVSLKKACRLNRRREER